MRYRYTLSNGYDKLMKQRLERAAIYAVPAAVLLIVGVASFTSNTFQGPGVGSQGTDTSKTVQTGNNSASNMQNTANHGSEQGTPNSVQQTEAGSTVNTQNNTAASGSGSAAASATPSAGGVASTGAAASSAASSVTGGRGGNETVAPSTTAVTPPKTTSPVASTPKPPAPTTAPVQQTTTPVQNATTTVTNQVTTNGDTTTVGNVLPVTVCTKVVANVCVN
jgi:hypothetical protein